MPHLDHTAFVNSCRDERSLSHHTLRAYTQDLRTFARLTKAHMITGPLSKEDVVAYHRHLRDDSEVKPATIERRLSTLKSYFSWCAERTAPCLPRPIDRDILKAALHPETGMTNAQSADQAFAADQRSQS